MQAWTEAEKSMSKPSCFLILNQESSQRGKLEYLVPLREGETSRLANSILEQSALPCKLEIRSKDSWQVTSCQ